MTHTVRLKFDDIDNTTLQRLCGALDENLAALGKALAVQASRRFADFTFIGEHAHAARRALLALADTAQSRDLTAEDIQLAAVEAKTADAQHVERSNDNHAYHFHTKRGNIGGHVHNH